VTLTRIAASVWRCQTLAFDGLVALVAIASSVL
jgi:hypothetical protein